ncbi:MAG: c-type cytochrome [Flavobacteriales bacterium]|nr:c-type cytochrome [Flavobacteriales bacterium]
MNKITNLTKASTLFRVSLFCLSFLFFQLDSYSQDGKELFKANCAACHSVGSKKVVGPGLEGINDKYSSEWLNSWTKNSTELIASGDADAIAIFEANNKIPMPPQNLTDEEMAEVYSYIGNPEGYSVSGGDVVESAASGGDLAEVGKKLFKANCAACHNVGTKVVVGPGLQGVNDKYDREWLGKWIKNSGELIASGDADANAIFGEFKKSIMPPQAVNDEDIDAILSYIANPGTNEVAVVEDAGGGEVVEEDNSKLKYVFGAVILLLIVLIITLNKTGVFMREMEAKNDGRVYDGPTTLWGSFMKLMGDNKGIVAAIVIVLFFGGLVSLMDGAFQIGVRQGYKPEQPIKFSHKIHAGDNQIDCNYCHSSARHSKTSGIPSLNVCMNCHKAIDGSDGKTFMYNGSEYSMVEEIQKIYNHLDYNPETQEYGDNPTPVRWIKVHNLPDHVYYSHEQHVTAGKQKCQTCHGPVEEMDVVEQHAQLTMKWCIECHKETAVSTEGNGYYDEMHKRMTPEFKEKVLGDGVPTVDEIGGWECAKCHY